ncbi:MAG: hypothetical protein QM726_20110 [Chitinophagaceae bacterium]
MKRLMFILLLIPVGLIFSTNAKAQVSISVNIGNQPEWAPEGYDDAQYYYIPDMDIYYDVPAHQFVYLSNRRWVRTSTLPPSYRKFDLYRIHKVPINQRDAYKFHDRDVKQYAGFKGKFDQHPIRDSKDNKYANNRNNWNNNSFKRNDHKGGRPQDPHHDGHH